MLGPCLFVVIYLFFSTTEKRYIIIPTLYFFSLTVSFFLPLLSIFPEFNPDILMVIFLLNENFKPALSFLFILQFIQRKPPALIYWAILALPVIGGGQFIYLSSLDLMACYPIRDFHPAEEVCISSDQLAILYRVICSAVLFMLLLPLMRKAEFLDKKDKERRHEYWIIIMLIVYNLGFFTVDLLEVAKNIDVVEANFVKTMIGVAFVYLALSSIFRIFNQAFYIKSPVRVLSDKDEILLEKIKIFIEEERPYQDLKFNRGVMADKFAMTEQYLSYVINTGFKKSFSELMNEQRIIDAKKLLKDSTLPITTISFDVGFSSITSFNRVFKEITGIPPSIYRNREKDKN